MSNWLSGLRRFGLLLVTGCAALIASSGFMHAQGFTITKVSKNSASFPAVAVGSDGNLNLVWIDSVNGLQFARSTSSANGTALGTPVDVPGPGGTVALPAFQPQIAVYMTQPNVIEIAWAAVHPGSSPTTYDVFASRSEKSGAVGTFISTQVGGPVALFDSPRLAFDFSGKTNIVWGQHDVLIAQAQDGLNFGTPVSLLQVTPPATPPDTGGPRIAVSVDNHIFVAWTDEQARNQPGSYCTTPTKDPTGTFFTNTLGGNFWMNETPPPPVAGAPFNFSGTNTRRLSDTDWLNGGGLDSRYPNGFFGCSYDNLRMFTDKTGQVDLLWAGDDQDILISQNHGRGPVAMSFSFPINLANQDASFPDVAVDKAGNFYIVWSGGPGPFANAEGIFFRRFDVTTDKFGPQLSIAPAQSLGSAFPQIAIDSNSNVNIAWEQPTAAIKNDGTDVFNTFFARSVDGGNTFPTVSQVTTSPSVLCFRPGPFFPAGAVPTTPDFTTCGTVQIGVSANSTPDVVWVNQASGAAVADIDFATSTSPTGTLSSNAVSLTASSATANVSITVNGFTAPITFSCLDADKNAALPSWLACSFSPPTLNPAQGNTDTLTITRQATPTSGMFISTPSAHNLPAFGRSMAWSITLATLSLMTMLLLAMGRRRDLGRAILMRGFLVMTLTIVLAAGLVSCGGGTSKSTSGTTGGTGGTGGGSTVTMHVAIQAQSGGSTTTLGTVTITAQ